MQELGAQQDNDGVEAIRCADCGALNSADADWCGQCLRSFAPPSPPAYIPPETSPAPPLISEADPLFGPPAPPAPADDAFDALLDPLGIGFGSVGPGPAEDRNAGDAGAQGDTARPVGAAPVVRREGAFAIAGDEISWTCDRCDTDNELSAPACRVCGTRFGAAPQPSIVVTRDPNNVAMLSLFFPGAGHAYLGMWAQAIARAALTIWVLAVVLVAALQKGVPGSGSIVVIFGATAFALWGLTAHDAYREASNDPSGVILRPRIFLYLTIGLLFALFASVMAAVINATPQVAGL